MIANMFPTVRSRHNKFYFRSTLQDLSAPTLEVNDEFELSVPVPAKRAKSSNPSNISNELVCTVIGCIAYNSKHVFKTPASYNKHLG